MIKETPLIHEHRKRKARFISFAGWKMPLQFTHSKAEHLHVRKHIGLFDISHMGEIRVQGSQALNFLLTVSTNQIDKIDEGQSQYSLICNDRGGIIDDIIIYCIQKPSDYLLCVNASNCEKDFQWLLRQNAFPLVQIHNQSDLWGGIAVQGPKSPNLINVLFHSKITGMKKFYFDFFSYRSEKLLISRTGYTGEDGFEIFSPISVIQELWRDLLSYEDSHSVIPAGLAARDTLRLEMKYPLHGSDMDENTTPAEMGLQWACKNKENFIGKQPGLKKSGKKWAGFTLLSAGGIPRKNYIVQPPEEKKEIGRVTSGALSPTLNKVIGTALLQKDFTKAGSRIMISIHGQNAPAQVAPTPFLKQNHPAG